MIPAEQITNLHRLAPELVLCIFGIIIMFLDPFVKPPVKRLLAGSRSSDLWSLSHPSVSWLRIPAPPTAI